MGNENTVDREHTDEEVFQSDIQENRILQAEIIDSWDHTEQNTLCSAPCYDSVNKEYLLVGGLIKENNIIGEDRLTETNEINCFSVMDRRWERLAVYIPEVKNGCIPLIKHNEEGDKFLFCYGGFEDRVETNWGLQDYVVRDYDIKGFFVYDFATNYWKTYSERPRKNILKLATAAFVTLSGTEYFVVCGSDALDKSSPRIEHGNLVIKKFNHKTETWKSEEIHIDKKGLIHAVTILGKHVYLLIGPPKVKQILLLSREMELREQYKIKTETILKRYDMEACRWDDIMVRPFDQFEYKPSTFFGMKSYKDRFLIFLNYFTLSYSLEACEEAHKKSYLSLFDTEGMTWKHYDVQIDKFVRFRGNNFIVGNDRVCVVGGRTCGQMDESCSDIIRIDISPTLEDFKDHRSDVMIRLSYLRSRVFGEENEFWKNNRFDINVRGVNQIFVSRSLLI